MRQGHYFGTEVDGKWWRRYREPGYFARGKGEYNMDEGGIHFNRMLAKETLLIGWGEVTAARIGKWHAGQWGAGRPVLKVYFERDGLKLSSGFTLSKDGPEMERLATDISAKAAQTG